MKSKQDWHSQPRASRIANVLFPNLASEAVQKEMKSLAATERKHAPAGPKLLTNADRGACSPLDGRATKSK